MKVPSLIALLLCCVAGMSTIGHAEPAFARGVEPVTTCPAPAPTNLTVLSSTPTSVTLAWIGPAGSGVYYRVSVFDQTAGVPLAPVYVTTQSTTVSGLPQEHCFEFTVSASYCNFIEMGHESVPCYGCTGVIIIDIIAEFPNPNPENPGNSIRLNGTLPPVQLCLERSTTIYPNFNKPLSVQFKYANSDVRVGLGLENAQTNNIYTKFQKINGQAPSSLFALNETSVPEVINLSYNHVPIVKIEYLEIYEPTSFSIAEVEFTLLNNNFQEFKYWSTTGCPGLVMPRQGGQQHVFMDTRASDRFAEEAAPAAVPQPNPFSTSFSYDFNLPLAGAVDIRLFNALGKQVQVVWQNELQAAGSHTATVYGEGLSNGLYFMEVRLNGQRKVFPIVKGN